MIERGDPLFALGVRLKHVCLVTARTSNGRRDIPVERGRPVVFSQAQRLMLNEVDIDFRISGMPHSVVKQAENFRVRDRLLYLRASRERKRSQPRRHSMYIGLSLN